MNCPHCQRLLYSRQHRTCGFCGGELPDECRLEDWQIAEMKAEQAAIAHRREIAKAKDEEEKRKQADNGASATVWLHIQ